MGGSVILVRHNLRIIPPVEHNFEHNTLVSRVTPESIILYFSSIIRQTLNPGPNQKFRSGYSRAKSFSRGTELGPTTGTGNEERRTLSLILGRVGI